jgi:hypothetical protein
LTASRVYHFTVDIFGKLSNLLRCTCCYLFPKLLRHSWSKFWKQALKERLSAMEASVTNALCVSLPRSAHEVLICGLPVISLKCLGFGVFRFALDVAGQPARCSTTRKGIHSSTFTLIPIFEDDYALLHLTLLLRIIDFSKLTSLRSLTLDNALSLVLIRAALRRPLSGTPLPNNCADPRIITDRASHKPPMGTCTPN